MTKEAKDFIADIGYDDKFGARPLKRAIQKYLEDPLAEEIINSGVKEGDIITVKLNKEQNSLKMDIKSSNPKGSKPKKPKATPKATKKPKPKDGKNPDKESAKPGAEE